MEWISVDDLVPEYADNVVLTGTYMGVSGEYQKFVSGGRRTKTDENGENYYTERSYWGEVIVTQWQPLPEAPK